MQNILFVQKTDQVFDYRKTLFFSKERDCCFSTLADKTIVFCGKKDATASDCRFMESLRDKNGTLHRQSKKG
ncbi:hypothetical protein LAU_0133 [Lausannevirus]|uniref:Uncharacterized protein n=1 Tax=Lausannevirus TaxID=999883 RepID=F2WL61_9VIRU|nr:hypothetical protein LAU_0133 [Lausannevirus]AEA06984.1 hypothetical protein LAU_0133 [Lausannevirus]